ncbi:hypothetical protein BROC_02031 [Candidatus Brocadiaceae bacterium]|nr:hypothetical protein BROC_02031 [Candidatus Brocadiaceae bacterium]
MLRNRTHYACAVVLIIISGITSRHYHFFPAFLNKYPEDALWALMVFLGFCFIFQKQKTRYCALYALLFSFGIEFSQLYQANWLNTIRQTTLGHLILGSGFDAIDFIAYSIGIVLGILIEYCVLTSLRKTPC